MLWSEKENNVVVCFKGKAAPFIAESVTHLSALPDSNYKLYANTLDYVFIDGLF